MLTRRKKVYIKVFLNKFMLIIIIYSNNNSFLFFWLWIIIVITWFIENLMITDIFGITWNRGRLPHCHIFFLLLHYSHLHSFHYIGQSHSVLQNHSCMWCLVTFNWTFFLTSQKGDNIAAVDYLKLKNDVTHWKTPPIMSPNVTHYPWQLANPHRSKVFAFK